MESRSEADDLCATLNELGGLRATTKQQPTSKTPVVLVEHINLATLKSHMPAAVVTAPSANHVATL